MTTLEAAIGRWSTGRLEALEAMILRQRQQDPGWEEGEIEIHGDHDASDFRAVARGIREINDAVLFAIGNERAARARAEAEMFGRLEQGQQ